MRLKGEKTSEPSIAAFYSKASKTFQKLYIFIENIFRLMPLIHIILFGAALNINRDPTWGLMKFKVPKNTTAFPLSCPMPILNF